MYIVAIAWLYVILMMAITEPSITAGVLTFLFYGALPCALFLWLFGTPQRKRQQETILTSAKISEQAARQPDRTNPQTDQ